MKLDVDVGCGGWMWKPDVQALGGWDGRPVC